jgi:hypothetical protein
MARSYFTLAAVHHRKMCDIALIEINKEHNAWVDDFPLKKIFDCHFGGARSAFYEYLLAYFEQLEFPLLMMYLLSLELFFYSVLLLSVLVAMVKTNV